jgi:hypothetical protein
MQTIDNTAVAHRILIRSAGSSASYFELRPWLFSGTVRLPVQKECGLVTSFPHLFRCADRHNEFDREMERQLRWRECGACMAPRSPMTDAKRSDAPSGIFGRCTILSTRHMPFDTD